MYRTFLSILRQPDRVTGATDLSPHRFVQDAWPQTWKFLLMLRTDFA